MLNFTLHGILPHLKMQHPLSVWGNRSLQKHRHYKKNTFYCTIGIKVKEYENNNLILINKRY